MASIVTAVVAGRRCMLICTRTEAGWRVAGYFKDRAVVVEGFAAEDEALDAWKCRALVGAQPAVPPLDSIPLTPPYFVSKPAPREGSELADNDSHTSSDSLHPDLSPAAE